MSRGRFLVIEGIDGSGKTTVARSIASKLGSRAVLTSEPYRREFVSVLEGIVAERDEYSVAAKVLAFTADRAAHTRYITSVIAEGRDVVCDRYFMSTIAYQAAELGITRGRRMDWIREVNSPFSQLPDAVLYLDSDPSLSLGRIGGRRSRLKVYEEAEFLTLVRRNYLSEMRRFPGRKFVLDADIPLGALRRKALEAALSVLKV